MKKIIRKVKGKKVLSFVLAAIMLATTFNMALPMLKLDASAAVSIGGITQERVVGVSDPTKPTYNATYTQYMVDFLNGASKPTDIVIPGLNAKKSDGTLDNYNDFVVQGLSYYAKQDWIMISVYHKTGFLPSMILALDAKTGVFKHAFEIWNDENGTENKDHGGGLAFSEYNFYYSGDDSDVDEGDSSNGDADQIAYAPLTYFDNPTDSDKDGYCEVVIKDAVDLPEMWGAATAYVCYDEGILWAGNFYEDSIGAGDYNKAVTESGKFIDAGNGIKYGNSMIYGYKLQGSSSAEEWAYLSGDKGSSDCAGSPSHAIAVNTNIEDIQYAVVDSGRLYLSRSWGTGANDERFANQVIGSWIAELPQYSTLTIADIDLSVAGTIPINYKDASGNTKQINAHYVADPDNDPKTTNYNMMPMSEGLCFIDGNLYISFEGASNKYMNEYSIDLSQSISTVTNTGNCDYPIDVVWKVDPYALVDREKPSPEEKSFYYEQITDLDQINSEDEYIIVYESPEKDPVTQNNILYAIDAYGGFKDYKLAKRRSGETNGYDGMVGHKITDYSLEGNKLYLRDEKDDASNIRWTINSLKTVSSTEKAVAIQNDDLYFLNTPNFYCDANTICMTDDTILGENMHLYESGNEKGGFWIANSGAYLWCNDGTTESYNTTINNFYSSSSEAMYNGLTEQPGTFHANATSADNIIKKSIPSTDSYSQRVFYIYKRVIDTYASTAESRVYTDLNAELQSDGTYTVNLETYAISPSQFKMLDTQRPTDFIFVIDASSSMQSESNRVAYRGHKRWGVEDNGDPCALTNINLTGGTDFTAGYDDGAYKIAQGQYTNESNPSYYKTPEGEYYQLYGALSNKYDNSGWFGSRKFVEQCYWAYYYNESKQLYYIAGKDDVGYTWNALENKVKNFEDNTGASSSTQNVYNGVGSFLGVEYRSEVAAYTGPHYTVEDTITRLDLMKESVNGLIDKISADCTDTKQHRVAVVQYGCDGENFAADETDKEYAYYNTGMYKKDGSFVQYNGSIDKTACASAFFTKDQFNKLKYRVIDYIESPVDFDADTFSNFGYEMANGIIENSDSSYYADSDRSVCVIMITDGVPGLGVNDKSKADSTANQAIQQAYNCKTNGATSYSVLIGSITDYDKMDRYMDYVSSEYIYAQSFLNPGDKNPNGQDYHIEIDTSSTAPIDTFVNTVYNSVQANSTTGHAKLNAASILREHLTNAFIVPDKYDTTFTLVDGQYDCLERFSFEKTGTETTAVSAKIETEVIEGSTNNNSLIITGYDYSDKYIAPGHPGQKLVVTIEGLLANPNADITNTSINQTASTAIYQNVDWMKNNNALKYFPTEYFTIPEYTYVMDYGLKMLDTAINGTLCSVSDLPTRQYPYKNLSENEVLEITNSNSALYYTLKPDAYANEEAEDGSTDYSAYSLIKRDNGSYDWFKIKLVPASNVLYEESALTLGKVEERKAYHWNGKGSPAITYQDLSTEKDVYGYDNHYKSSIKHSNDTYYQSSVDSVNKRSDTAVFKFKGTGFDLISACGPNTGVQLVNIKRDGKMVRGFIVDTYYDGEFVSAGEDKFYQVPIVSWDATSENLADDVYGEYTVEVTSYYLSSSEALKNHQSNQTTKKKMIDTGLVMNYAKANEAYGVEDILADAGISDTDKVDIVWFDDNSVLNGGTGASVKKGSRAVDANGKLILDNYIDGIRVYNPIQDTSSYIESERNATYYNIIDELASTNDILNGTINNKVAFVTGSLSEGTLSFANYESIGPEGEFYLNAGSASNAEALVFNTRVAEGGRVMISLRAVNDPTTVKINGTEFAINSATEMYYDITDLLNPTEIATGSAKVTIINTGGGILSVNNIKLTNTVAYAGLMSLNEEDLATVQYYANMEPVKSTVKNGVVTPVEDEEDIPEDNTNTDNDNTNDDANTEESEKEEFSLFSLIEMLIAFIEKILYNAFGAGSMA